MKQKLKYKGNTLIFPNEKREGYILVKGKKENKSHKSTFVIWEIKPKGVTCIFSINVDGTLNFPKSYKISNANDNWGTDVCDFYFIDEEYFSQKIKPMLVARAL